MNPAKIKELIRIAQESVADIEDVKLKDKTYEIILNNLMSGKKTKPKLPDLPDVGPDKVVQEDSISYTNPTVAISKKFNVKEEKVSDYFELNDDRLEILCPISMKSSAEEHLVFTLLVLTLRKISFNEREIDSAQLRELAKLKGVKSLVNLSTNLKKYPEYIIHKHGKIGSTIASYKLTVEGYNKGVELIQKIFSGSPLYEQEGTKKYRKTIAKRSKSALAKEIEKLYQEGFFDTFKTVTDAQKELRKRTFFNKRQEIDVYIRQQFTKRKGLLLREKKGKTWHYIKRK